MKALVHFLLAFTDITENLVLYVDERFRPSRRYNSYKHTHTTHKTLPSLKVPVKDMKRKKTILQYQVPKSVPYVQHSEGEGRRPAQKQEDSTGEQAHLRPRWGLCTGTHRHTPLQCTGAPTRRVILSGHRTVSVNLERLRPKASSLSSAE